MNIIIIIIIIVIALLFEASFSHPPWSKGLDGVHVPGSWKK